MDQNRILKAVYLRTGSDYFIHQYFIETFEVHLITSNILIHFQILSKKCSLWYIYSNDSFMGSNRKLTVQYRISTFYSWYLKKELLELSCFLYRKKNPWNLKVFKITSYDDRKWCRRTKLHYFIEELMGLLSLKISFKYL